MVCVGSTKKSVAEWQRDLLEFGSGGIGVVGRSSNVRGEADRRKACPIRRAASCWRTEKARWFPRAGKIVWCCSIWTGKSLQSPVLTALPGYPGRLSPRAQGGAWLSLFAPRNQLVEFVRRERTYRRAMMAEVPKEFWVAPALSSGASFSEPMQGGALIQMGILKPWAPTRSYGLVVALDDHHTPVASFHSRTGGTRHGLTSASNADPASLSPARAATRFFPSRFRMVANGVQ